ncbi:MAG: epimerase, partial [Bacteroidetes bacterium]
VDERPGEPLELRADISLLRELGWEPKYSLAHGVARCLAGERPGGGSSFADSG